MKILMNCLKKIAIGLGAILLIVAAAIGIGIFISYKCLTVSNYTIHSDRIKSELKIVMIADLHDASFGKNNNRLVKKIQKEQPDLILMVGDMVNDTSKDSDMAVGLVEQLKETAPVYYSWGNQELDNPLISQKDLKSQLESAGAVVLEKKYEDIKVKGNKIRVGGIYDYAFSMNSLEYIKEGDLEDDLYHYLKDFEKDNSFKIMMAHRPDSFIFGAANFTWNIDLVVSGHTHGGQVIIPGKGGLYGAEQGWFPKYVDGIHHFKTVKNMVITRGLGSSSEKLPRFNNIPEIVSITLKAKE